MNQKKRKNGRSKDEFKLLRRLVSEIEDIEAIGLTLCRRNSGVLNIVIDGTLNQNDATFHTGHGQEKQGGKTESRDEQTAQAIEQKSEKMKQAVQKTYDDGLWWNNRSWAVVYRIWQMKGYVKGMSDFVRDVAEWNLNIDYECKYDAVQKPINKGVYAGPVETWISNGAPLQAVNLARNLLNEF